MAGVPLREVLARFGVEVDATKLAAFDGKVKASIDGLRDLGTAVKATGLVFGASYIANGLRNMVNGFSEAADEIDDTSAFLAMSREELQAWRFAAGQNGLSVDQLTAGFQRLTAAGEAAMDGGKKQTKAFKDLGVGFKDADGALRPIGTLLPEIADGFSKLAESKRAGIALDLFGKSGLRLLPLLSQGAEGLAKFREEMAALGGGMSEKDIEAAGEYRDAVARLEFAFMSLKARALGPLMPALEKAVDWFGRGIGYVSRLGEGLTYLARQTNLFETAATMVGLRFGPMLAQWGGRLLPMVTRGLRALPAALRALWPVISPIALAIAKFLALSVAIDEVITLFQGGKSVVEDFVDSIFGLGATQEFLDGFRAVWDDITYGIQLSIAAVKDLWAVVSGGDVSNLDKLMNARPRGSNVGAALSGDRSLGESGRLRREDKGAEALRQGDVKGFVDARRKGETREQAFERFKSERKTGVLDGSFAPRAEDKALLTPREEKTLTRAKAAGITTSRDVVHSAVGKGAAPVANTAVTINLPPGADKALIRQVEAIVKGALGKQARDLKVALTNGAG